MEYLESTKRRAEPPDVTKYRPRLAITRKNPTCAQIMKPHSTEALERMNIRGRTT